MLPAAVLVNASPRVLHDPTVYVSRHPLQLLPVEVLQRPIESAQYTSEAFARCTNSLGVRQSMGRTGICWDNAQAESFFASLKVECVHRTALATRERARRVVGRWIETWYNQRRRHSALDYTTPNERYWQLTQEAQAA